MQVNGNRALLWGGAIAALVTLVAFLIEIVYGFLVLAVLLLVGLVVVNRLREAKRAEDLHPFLRDAGMRRDDQAAPVYDDWGYDDQGVDDRGYDDQQVTYDDEVLYEERGFESEPAASEETTFSPDQRGILFEETDQPYELDQGWDDEAEQVVYEEVYESEDPEREDSGSYIASFEETAVFEEPGLAVSEEESLEEVHLEEVDAREVLADEGVLDEAKVTSDQAILAASQATAFDTTTLSDEEANAETREILGRVAALLAKYE